MSVLPGQLRPLPSTEPCKGADRTNGCSDTAAYGRSYYADLEAGVETGAARSNDA